MNLFRRCSGIWRTEVWYRKDCRVCSFSPPINDENQSI